MSQAYSETPAGSINSSNVTFTLAAVPLPAASLSLYLNGLFQRQGAGFDYTLSGLTITFTVAPLTGDILLASYSYGQSTSTTGSTITLQSRANFFSTFADLLPLTGIGGYTNEPFLSICNDAFSDLICDPGDWKFNRAVLALVVTCPNKQDYKFSGAAAFSLGNTSQGWAIDLASNNAITVSGGVVTVTTIEPHRFAVGDVIYLNGMVAKNAASASKYNSVFTDNGNSSAWSSGYTITSNPTANTFTFAAASGQSNGDILGSPGIFDFAYGTSGSMVQMVDSSSPQYVQELSVHRETPVTSRVNNPSKVSVIMDDNNGTITVRFFLVPGQTTWGANIVYQKKAPTKSELTDTISPFPDHLVAVVNQAILYRLRTFQRDTGAAAKEYQVLQTAIRKALGFQDTEATDVSMKPESPLMDDSVLPFFFFN